ncbi:MAG TPA: PAC2 family protein, partial [Candidatus Thalassarchaeaceae archaeon]|nr:PAC2 family protein [Candidatus Thalassarchaeaceae archaeon]
MDGTPLVKFDESIDTEGAIVVSCFPTVSMVSNIVAHYLVEHLDLQFVGGVRDSRLPAVCLVQDGEPLPPIRFYAGEPQCNVDGCDKLIVVLS